MSGEYFPLSAAFAFAPKIKNCEARGPAPQVMYFFVISGNKKAEIAVIFLGFNTIHYL